MSTRWLMQTKTGGGGLPPEERGDCVPACIASILGLPIEAVANCHGDGWWDRLQAAVARHGYCIAVLDIKLEPPPCYWIASVPSLNLPVEPDGRQPWHCVVARGYELVHDPCIAANRYDAEAWADALDTGKLAEGWVLAPLDPAARGSVQVEGAVEGREIIRRLLDAAEPKAHKNGPQADAEWGSRTGGIPDCPWCAAREFLTARLPERPDEGEATDPQARVEAERRRLVEGKMSVQEAESYLSALEREAVELADAEVELRVAAAEARRPERPDEGERDA